MRSGNFQDPGDGKSQEHYEVAPGLFMYDWKSDKDLHLNPTAPPATRESAQKFIEQNGLTIARPSIPPPPYVKKNLFQRIFNL